MNTGTLYVIASPIGNLEDITFRALRILREETKCVYCEDTRQTRKLLEHYGIKISARSLHAHSSEGRIGEALDVLKGGESIAYLTDSGTPGVSDPGSRLVEAAHLAGIPVVPIPGASALPTLLSVAGFAGKTVIFTGFLSKREGRMRRELERYRDIESVIVMYESPYRAKRLLALLCTIFPTSRIAIGREMTKYHEEIITGEAPEIAQGLDGLTQKGEFTIAVWNRPSGTALPAEDDEA
ncbi:MAG: 16S rRNA (cytidine(1402)-2'-O)-methyltransferase [Spirochaetes bacterium]|nr:MAG: 16S rRNA (cytidine(1402)-2'-O)-methyltransferase [Spirochaetota bacterium]